jgi:hypothetical protein
LGQKKKYQEKELCSLDLIKLKGQEDVLMASGRCIWSTAWRIHRFYGEVLDRHTALHGEFTDSTEKSWTDIQYCMENSQILWRSPG